MRDPDKKSINVQGREKKGLQILLSYSQAGPGRKAKQDQEEISRNHVPTFFLGSVLYSIDKTAAPSGEEAMRTVRRGGGMKRFNDWLR